MLRRILRFSGPGAAGPSGEEKKPRKIPEPPGFRSALREIPAFWQKWLTFLGKNDGAANIILRKHL